MRVRRLVALLLLCVLSGCRNPNSPSNFAQIGGSWQGTLDSTNWNPTAIQIALSQANGTINGTWNSPVNDWNGQITGTVTKTQFSGTFTFSGPNAAGIGPRCTGSAAVAGPASTNVATLDWTGPGFTGSCTGLPINLKWALRR